MKRFSKVGLALAALIVPGAGVALGAEPAIDILVEQGGAEVPLEDHRVALERAPFDLVFVLPAGTDVGVSSSFSSKVYDMAASGAPLGGSDLGAAFPPLMYGSEAPFNESQDLWVDELSLHSWGYDPDSRFPHRFDEVTPDGDRFRCRRTVAVIGLKQPRAIQETTEESLYLVFYVDEADPEGGERREVFREYLRIDFR